MVKLLTAVEIKAADRGEVRAVFSRFGVEDKDGDVTLPGAFEAGAEVPISAYGHKSWEGALPVGKAVIRADDQSAWVDARFFLTTMAGRETFETVKLLGALGQWSYGYEVIDSEVGEFNGKRARFLKRVRVNEVSPVLVGAGVDTRTIDAKSPEIEYELARARWLLGEPERRQREELRAIRAQLGRSA